MKIKSIISSFLAVAVAMTATTALTSIDASAEDYGTAWVMYSATDNRTEQDKGSSDNVDATITGDGSYTAKSVASPSEKLELLVLQTDLKDTDYPDVKITVDSITVNGVAVEYSQSDDAFQMEKDAGYRVNILNTWGNEIKDIAEDVELPEADDGNATIEIAFSVSGLDSSDSESSDSESTSSEDSESSDSESTSSEDSSSSDSESTSSSDSSSSDSESTSSSDSSSSDSESSSTGSDLESIETSSTDSATTTAADLGVTPSTGVAGVAGLVTLSALATGAVVISRKKR